MITLWLYKITLLLNKITLLWIVSHFLWIIFHFYWIRSHFVWIISHFGVLFNVPKNMITLWLNKITVINGENNILTSKINFGNTNYQNCISVFQKVYDIPHITQWHHTKFFWCGVSSKRNCKIFSCENVWLRRFSSPKVFSLLWEI